MIETIKALKESLDIVESSCDTIRIKLQVHLHKYLRSKDIKVYCPTMGYQHCPNSEVLFCIYDESDDPVHDHCLICGQPEERK